MRQKSILATLAATLLFAFAYLGVATTRAQQAADPRIADLANAGKVRVGLFLPQFIKNPQTGELRSVWVEIARAFVARIGVPLVVIEHSTPLGDLQPLQSRKLQ